MSNIEIARLVDERIKSDPAMLNGKPNIRGTRFPVADVLELLASGMTVNEIVEEHPNLEPEDITASLYFAALRMKKAIVIHAE